jgi:hypothetical protein
MEDSIKESFMLTPEDKQRIEDEERYRAEVRGRLKADAAPVVVEHKPSNGVAAVLSLLPGAGHIYKGQIKAGLLWMVGVMLAYTLVIIPGIAAHIWCICDAGRDPKPEPTAHFTKNGWVEGERP